MWNVSIFTREASLHVLFRYDEERETKEEYRLSDPSMMVSFLHGSLFQKTRREAPFINLGKKR